jgi:hypothetical protein
MKIPAGANPSLVLSTDETRWIINHALVREGHLIATDGRRLIVQRISHEETDERREFLIGSAFLQKAFDACAVYYGCDNPDCEDPQCGREVAHRNPIDIAVGAEALSAYLGDGIVGHFKPDGVTAEKFVNWPQSIPAEKGTVKLSLNARFLLEIAEGLGCPADQVTIELDPDSDAPVVITHPEYPDRFALLCRCRLPHPHNFNPTPAPNTAWQFAQDQRAKYFAEKEDA